MEGRMSGYDTDDILSQALDLAENEDENIFISHLSRNTKTRVRILFRVSNNGKREVTLQTGSCD